MKDLLRLYYLKKKAFYLLTVNKIVMKKEENQNRNDEGFETGNLDQYDRHEQNDNREDDANSEHQNSTRRANPQVQNSKNQNNPNAGNYKK